MEMASLVIVEQTYLHQTRIEYWLRQMSEWWSHCCCCLILYCLDRKSSKVLMNLLHYKQIEVQGRVVKVKLVSRKFSQLRVADLH